MNININAFGSHSDSEENRGCIKDVDFLGQIDTLLGSNPTDEQLEEVRKTLFGTNKAWVPKWLFDDLVNVPVVPPTPGPEPLDHYILYFDKGISVLKVFGEASGNPVYIPSRVIIDGEDAGYSDVYPVDASTGHTVEIYDDPENPGYYNLYGIIEASGNYVEGGYFSGCNAKQIHIPDYITSIGDNAFCECPNLEKIIIGNNITSIKSTAFSGSPKINSILIYTTNPPILSAHIFSLNKFPNIYVPENSINAYKSANFWSEYGDKIYKIIDPSTIEPFIITLTITPDTPNTNVNVIGHNSGILVWTPSKVIINGVEQSIISPSYNLSLGDYTIEIFDEPENSNFYTMADYFKNCDILSINIPNYITSIGEYAFHHCRSLISVNIPNSVTSIGSGAFADCRSLISVNIPNSVTSIGADVFRECYALESIIINAINPPTLHSDNYYFNYCQIYVPAGSVDTYKAAPGWSNYADHIQAIPSE